VLVAAAGTIAGLGLRRAAPTAVEAEVRALGCGPAAVTGRLGRPDAPLVSDEEVARALGAAACARLAVALGIPWGEAAPSHALTVRAELAEAHARVTLALAGHEASAEAATPIAAVDAVVAALADRVPTPRWSVPEIRAWGADDEAGARRIARVFRRRDLRLAPDIHAEVLRLQETDAGSPFCHVLPLMIVGGSREVIQSARERTLARLDRLPPSRAHLLHGLVLLFPSVLDHDEGVRLLRQSYAEAPDDPEMVGLYASLAIRLGLPEAHSVFERLIARTPARAIAAFDQALIWAAENDPERDARYVGRLLEVHPEARASPPVVRHFLRAGRLDEAERAVALGERLGLGDVHRTAAVEVALAAGRLAEARRHAETLLGAPAPLLNVQGAEVLVTSLFREGRVDDALTAFAGVEKLGVDGGWAGGAARLVVRELCARRWLQRPGTSPAMLAWLARAADAPTELTGAARAEARVQLALASAAPADGLAALLAEIEAEARAADTPFAQADLTAVSVPLVRAVRGDAAAAAAWTSARRARIAFKLRAAIDAGLALEAVGDAAGAAEAYAVALDPAALRESGVERVIAAVRRSRIAAATGGADPLRAELDALARTGDAGLIAAVRRLE
jgi:tetratricopeptide (TPR) repeat protein